MRRFPATFHEEGRAFTWNVVTREVRNADGHIAYDCYNMDAARVEARNWIKRTRRETRA